MLELWGRRRRKAGKGQGLIYPLPSLQPQSVKFRLKVMSRSALMGKRTYKSPVLFEGEGRSYAQELELLSAYVD